MKFLTPAAEGVPWFLPRLEPELRCLIRDDLRPVSVDKGNVIVGEDDYPDKLIYICEGILEQSTVSNICKKPFAVLSICLEGSMTGRMLMLSKYASPVRVTALRKSRVIIIPFARVREAITSSFPLYQQFTSYCSRCDHAEFSGMSIIGTHSAEDRLKLFFAALIGAHGQHHADEWLPLPIKFSRNEIASITHSTRLTIDRVLAQWIRNDVYRNMGKGFLVHKSIFDGMGPQLL